MRVPDIMLMMARVSRSGYHLMVVKYSSLFNRYLIGRTTCVPLISLTCLISSKSVLQILQVLKNLDYSPYGVVLKLPFDFQLNFPFACSICQRI